MTGEFHDRPQVFCVVDSGSQRCMTQPERSSDASPLCRLEGEGAPFECELLTHRSMLLTRSSQVDSQMRHLRLSPVVFKSR